MVRNEVRGTVAGDVLVRLRQCLFAFEDSMMKRVAECIWMQSDRSQACISLCQITKYEYIVAQSSAEAEAVEDFVEAEVRMSVVENRKL